MNTILRLLIVWLVLLAVPFQGFASAAMLGCGSGHAPAAPSAPAGGSEHEHGHAQGHEHGGNQAQSGATGAHDHAAMAAAGHDAAPLTHHADGKCSACSACSIGAAMAPAALPALAVHAPPALSVPFAADHVSSVDLALPERPPRTRLA